jgi:cyanate permease
MDTAQPLRWLVLFGVWFIYGAFGLVATSLAPLVPLVEADLGMSHAAMGSVMGAWQLTYIAAAVPCGILLDRLGSRWALALGAACVAASAYGRGIADGYGGLLCAVMLFGLGGPIISAGAPKVIATWFQGPSRGLAMGIYITGPAIGGALSLSLTHAWLLPHFDGDWRRIFVAWAAVAAASGAVWWLLASLPGVRPSADERHPVTHTPYRQVIGGLLRAPPVRLVLVMSVGAFLIGHGLNNWLPELLVAGGMGVVEAGYWAAIPTLVGIGGSLLIPRLATPERRLAILSALCVTVVVSTVLLHFSERPLLLAGLILQGIARSSLMTVMILTLVELPSVGARNAGTAAGLFFAAGEMGGVLGPLTLGILYDLTHGFGASLTLLSVIALALVYGVHRLRALTGT